MYMIHPVKTELLQYGVKVVFVSRRVAKLIMKKSRERRWLHLYFPLDNVVMDETHIVVGMSTRGVILVTKKNLKRRG